MEHDRYESPLAARYASEKMLRIFSPNARFSTWRRLWTALARAEHSLGLPVTAEQVTELEAHIYDIDYEAAARKEREIRHDVMAHVYAYGLVCPAAAPIIHLGATSCFVTDNADLILYRDALRRIRASVCAVLSRLASFAERYKALPAPGFTHYQNAQPVTVGKRACLWMQDLLLDVEEIDAALAAFRFLGCRGATGTEASFVELFCGDTEKIDRMNRMLAEEFGFTRLYEVCGQTYPRKLDSRILSALSGVAQSAYKFACDMRLLQHDEQLEEPFGRAQVGSSAMAYKRNPMRAERMCSLARFVIVNAQNADQTAAAQWLERTLDDSANRRVAIPEAFLATDAILRLYADVAGGIVVNEAVIARALSEQLPFLASENLLMEAVRAGGDRQACHESIRRCAMESREQMRLGRPCDLVERLCSEKAFPLTAEQMQKMLEPAAYTGRSAEQTERFLAAHPLEAGADMQEINL